MYNERRSPLERLFHLFTGRTENGCCCCPFLYVVKFVRCEKRNSTKYCSINYQSCVELFTFGYLNTSHTPVTCCETAPTYSFGTTYCAVIRGGIISNTAVYYSPPMFRTCKLHISNKLPTERCKEILEVQGGTMRNSVLKSSMHTISKS